jgi:hypothetical protein
VFSLLSKAGFFVRKPVSLCPLIAVNGFNGLHNGKRPAESFATELARR